MVLLKSKSKFSLSIIIIGLAILSVGLVTSCGAGVATEDTKGKAAGFTLVSQEFQFLNNVVTDSFFYTDITAPVFVLYDKDFKLGEEASITFSEFTLAKTAIPEDTTSLGTNNVLKQNKTKTTITGKKVQYVGSGTERLSAISFKLTDFVTNGGVADKAALDTLLQGVSKVYYKIVIKEIKKTTGSDGTSVNEVLSAYTDKTKSGSITVDRTGNTGNIYNEYDLKAIAKYLEADYTLQRDIELKLTSDWTSLGVFTGTLNGNGKTIKIATDGTIRAMNGLFSTIYSSTENSSIRNGSSASVKDLTIDVQNIIKSSKTQSGILAGDLIKGAIRNVTLTSSTYGDAGTDNDVTLNVTTASANGRGGLIGRILSTGSVAIDNVKVNLDLNITDSIENVGGVVGQIAIGSSVAEDTITLTNLEYVGAIKQNNASVKSVGGLVGFANPSLVGGNKLLTISGKVGSTIRNTEISANEIVGAAVGTLKNATLNVEVGNVKVTSNATTSKVGGAIGTAENVVATAKIGSLGSVFISGYQYIGGVVGEANGGSIITGHVDATGTANRLVQIVSLYTSAGPVYVGGLAGYTTNATVQGYVKFRNAAYDANIPIASAVPAADDVNLTALDKGGIVIKYTTNLRQAVGGLVGFAYDFSTIYGHAAVRISAPYVNYLGGLVGQLGRVNNTDGNPVTLVGYVSGTIYMQLPTPGTPRQNIAGIIGYRGGIPTPPEVQVYAKDLVIDARNSNAKETSLIALILGGYENAPRTENFRAFAINTKLLYTDETTSTLIEKTDRVVASWAETATDPAYALATIGAYVFGPSATASRGDYENIKIVGPNVNNSNTKVTFSYTDMKIGTNVGQWLNTSPPTLAGGSDIFGTQ